MIREEGRKREAEENHLGIWAEWAEQLVLSVVETKDAWEVLKK